jgi:GTP-binding protein HflX
LTAARQETGGRAGAESANSGRAYVLHPDLRNSGDAPARDPEACLAEAVGLAEAIELDIAGAEVLRIGRINAGQFIGKGQAERIAAILAAHAEEGEPVALVVVDTALSPVQQRNLERLWKAKVIDRTGLILEIFGARAQTREGRTQVELAALSYQRSRLVRSWTHLERQRGGVGFMGGPGESQLEIDRRLIDERIGKLKRDLEKIRQTRKGQRKARKRVPYDIVALVGYTNAGKSTLFNRLTEATVYAEDQLFATLDPTHRRLQLPSGRNIMLSDTVGFISDLPTQLVAAFRATLEEVNEADLLLHVRDISHPDTEAQRQDVLDVLDSLRGSDAEPPIEILNKIDLLDPDARPQALSQAGNQEQIAVSALTGEGCDTLKRRLDDILSQIRSTHDFLVDLSNGAAIAWLYSHGQVVARSDDQHHAHLSVALDPVDYERFSQKFGETA